MTRRPDQESPDDTLRTTPPGRTRKGTVVDDGLADRIQATHQTETNKDIAYYQGEVFTTLQSVGYSPEFAQEGVMFFTIAYNHCGDLLIAREKVLQYCALRSEGADHAEASQKILATLAIQTIIVVDEADVEQTTIVAGNEQSPDATFVEPERPFDAFDPRWHDQPDHIPAARPIHAVRTVVAQAVSVGGASVRPIPAPTTPIEAVVHHLSLAADPSRADTVIETNVRGDVAFKQALTEQGLACRKILISEGYSQEIAEEGSVYYQERLKAYAIPARAMQETRIYCQQRKLGSSIADATLVAQGKQTGIPAHDDAMDAKLEGAIRENKEKAGTRTKILLVLGAGLLLGGIIGGAYYVGAHKDKAPVETPPTAQP